MKIAGFVHLLTLLTTSLFAQVSYINTAFENASPVQWSIDSIRNMVVIDLIYDRERSSVNRANGHWHFKVEAEKGSEVRIELRNFDNIWNGRQASPVSDRTNSLASVDGRKWRVLPSKVTDQNTLQFTVHMDSSSMFIASVEPYRISDLEKLLSDIRSHPNVSIEKIGHTVEERPLEIIRIGKPGKRKSVFLRARAHAWEAGGNWVVEGLIRSLLAEDAGKYLDSYTVYIMPMTNKDGVARGKTRFNAMGMDLNRQWDKEPDSTLVPEKFAFEQWLKKQIAAGEKPTLAVDLHNDNFGTLHVNLPTEKNKMYSANMARFEKLLRQHTWFTEGISHVKNPGSLGEGLAARYGIDACVYEFNYDWIAGLKKDPMGADWMQLGGKLREVFLEYLK